MPNANYKQKLSDLLASWVTIPSTLDRLITGLSLDSRTINSGDLFIAHTGTNTDGAKFITEAKQHGAAAALIDINNNMTKEFSKIHDIFFSADTDITDIGFLIIPVAQLDENMGLIAARFYDNPCKNMKIIGVTGTNGKTTITQLIANALSSAGQTAGVVGTLGYGLAGELQMSTHTTPFPITLQQNLAELRDQNATIVALEASSHGLDQNRLSGTTINIAIFTNLTRDHLDYHQTMENYAHAKHKLFERSELRYGVFNLDDPYGQAWALEFSNKLAVYGYTLDASLNNKKAIANIIWADNIHLTDTGISAAIHTPWGEGILHSKLLGRFNLSNILAVITTLGILKIPFPDILAYLMPLSGIAGRMQALGGLQQPLIVVDYAHTPDALAHVLQSLREHCRGKLWCVFGCGGNRDAGKRAIMGGIVATYADEIIVTDDNPRDEQPQQIIEDIIAGIPATKSAIIEHDRHLAIAHAINCAHAGDVVLIAGKGHETYQQIGSEKYPFSDIVQAKMCLANKD